jgi:hypothetical protein
MNELKFELSVKKLKLFLLLFLTTISCQQNNSKGEKLQKEVVHPKRKKVNLNGYHILNKKKISSDSIRSPKMLQKSNFKNSTFRIENRSNKTNLKSIENRDKSFRNEEPLNRRIAKPHVINDPLKIPITWSNAYSHDPKWMEFYEETSDAFLTGWANEFRTNPNTRISKDELLFAYRRRMEKIFFQTPTFIEFCVSQLRDSEKFRQFNIDFESNVN